LICPIQHSAHASNQNHAGITGAPMNHGTEAHRGLENDNTIQIAPK